MKEVLIFLCLFTVGIQCYVISPVPCAQAPPRCGCPFPATAALGCPEPYGAGLPVTQGNPYLPAASPVSAYAPFSPYLPAATPCTSRCQYLKKIPIPPPCI